MIAVSAKYQAYLDGLCPAPGTPNTPGQPVFLLEIEGYNRAFSNVSNELAIDRSIINSGYYWNRSIGTFQVQCGVFSTGGISAGIARPPKAGNILIAILQNGHPPSGTPSVSGGATWTPLHVNSSSAGISVWWGLADGTNTFTFDDAWGAINYHSGIVLEIDPAAGSFNFGYGSGSSATASATAGSYTASFTLQGSESWEMLLFDFPSSTFRIAFMGGELAFTLSGGVYTETLPTKWIETTSIYLPNVPGQPFFGGDPSTRLLTFGGYADPWLVSLDPLKITISDLDGGSNLGDLVFNVQDVDQQLTADLATNVLEGKKCFLIVGTAGMTRGNYNGYYPMSGDMTQYFVGVINTVDSDNGNLEYKFTVPSFNLKKLTQKIFLTGDDGFQTSDKHPKTLNGHPLDMLVDALQQSGVLDIDTAKIYFYRDTYFSGLVYQFTLKSSPTAKDFLENELMKPLGMYLWENNLGQISINSFYPAMSGNANYTPPTPPVMTLTVDNTMDVPIAQEADLVNQVIFRFEDDGSGSAGFLAEDVETYAKSEAKYGLTDGHTIESQGMREEFQGFFMAAIISRLIFLRYGLKNLVLDPMPAIWAASVLEPGDIIALTEPYVPDRQAGVLGVTGKTFEILDRTWNFMAGTVEFRLLALDLSAFKQYLITGNAEADYTAASPTDQAKDMFLCDATDKYSNGDAAHTLG